MGITVLVEIMPSGHIVKTPKVNPYSPREEKENRQRYSAEALVS